MKTSIKYGAFVLIILAMIIWLGGFLSKREKPAEIPKQAPVLQGIETGFVEKAEEVSMPYTGHVVADKSVEVSTKIMGRIRGVFVNEGQTVEAGQPLLDIDEEEIQAQVSTAEHQIAQAEEALKSAIANYEAIKKTYDRYSALLKEGAITQQEFDQIKAQHEAAKSQVEQARAGVRAAQSQKQAIVSNLKYVGVTSPVSGVVVQKKADAGDLAVPGNPLIVIEVPPYHFEVFLPESLINKVKLGEKYEVHFPTPGINLTAKVVEVSPALDPATKTFRVKLKLQEYKGLKSGMYGNLLVTEKTEALLVPESSIVRRFDFTGVWVVNSDNTLELRFVRLGEKRGDKVEVLSGLKEGERIVIRGVEKACEGCKVGG